MFEYASRARARARVPVCTVYVFVSAYAFIRTYTGFSDFYGELNGGPLGLIDPAVCLGDNSSFVCLSKDSYITVGFEDNFIFDAPGQDDLFIEEVGSGNEFADIYLSSDHGVTFTFFGTINGGGSTGIDLHDIGYSGFVNAVKLVGLDNNGGAPGFDFAKIYGLPGSSCMANADVVLQDVCQDSIFDITGQFDGYWDSNLLIDSVLVTSDTGWLSLVHIVEDDVFGCPNDTAFIPIHITPCDCQGTPYGGFLADQCNQCLLPTDTLFDNCVDCAGVPFGNSEMDLCGQCLLPSDSLFNDCLDCAGVPFGASEMDQCGQCLLPSDSLFNACVDCAGVPFGNSVMDLCGQCLLPSDSLFNDCLDCAGVPFGESEMDQCGQCLLPSDSLFNACVDCAGVPFGNSEMDLCGQCLLPSDSLFNDCLDCAGVPFGESEMDQCGQCLLPTNAHFNDCVDCEGIPWGGKVMDRCNQCLLESDSLFNSCLDCAGVPFGNAIIDLCGQCLPPADSHICTEKTIFYLPNVFSPNADGMNDEFALFTRDGVVGEVLEYSIFSRWGELVYQAKNFPTYSTDYWWNGKINGKKARTGVYIYHMIIQLESGKVLNYSGDITVVR